MIVLQTKAVAVLALGIVPILVSGCGFNPQLDPRLTDGGGGNLLTAGAKVLAGEISSLTQDELQISSDEVSKAKAAFTGMENTDPPLTNDQSDAVIELLVANEINTIDDLTALIEAAKADSDNVVIPESLAVAFADADSDVNGDELEDILSGVFNDLN